mmetsp:Transcript_26341/g.25194  ORF Transcript_26341/g.25194 Transcript_26341/m.25194 type:complete len:159 (+) Transcript_26341:197-673(+)|eukprot:CAMPEP_0119034570 /NCGR_PEP_ID=MMETSP1177-20130426/1556_1 /TAXON_ID=2985 /ORGANISM="Ochromonas sp, Strain CCMP1899" /LENGTH=158 /DNA_ID=CAMNT_0006992093 /DNA_START=188 /DNA_END=664 /DNA_ORIENTATION=-
MFHVSKILLLGFLSIFRADFKTGGLIQYCIAGDASQTLNNESCGSNEIMKPSPEKLMLPPSKDEGDEGFNRQINLGEKIGLEELGPIIINADGTTRQITNWISLTKSEQDTTWRLIAARNLKRLKKLKSERADDEIPSLENDQETSSPVESKYDNKDE